MSASHSFHPGGTIRLIVGPMFSGKTSELVSTILVSQYAQRTCVVMRPSCDTRSAQLRTHSGGTLEGAAAEQVVGGSLVELATALLEREGNVGSNLLVAVDEGQFFPDLAEGASLLAVAGAHVVVAALNGSFRQTAFDAVSRLYPCCDLIESRSAICSRCRKREAPFTILQSDAVLSEQSRASQLEIGGGDKYQAVCRECMLARQ